MPRREGLPLFNFVKGCNVACRAYQLGYNTTVDCHRIAYLLSAYQRGVRMQFFAMTAFISRVLKIIPARCFSLVPSDSYAVGILGSVGIVGFYPESTLSPESPDSSDPPDSPKPTGIKNKTRATVNRSAGVKVNLSVTSD